MSGRFRERMSGACGKAEQGLVEVMDVAHIALSLQNAAERALA